MTRLWWQTTRGAAILLVFVRFSSAFCAGSPSSDSKTVPVTFEFHPKETVHSVSVVGDFNDWKPGATPLVGPDSSGRWKTVLRLPYGVYEYRFLVDGKKWLRDPQNPFYGGKNSNSLLILKDPEFPEIRLVTPLPGTEIRRFPVKIHALFLPGRSGSPCSEIKSVLQVDKDQFVPVLVQDSLITAYVDTLSEGFHQFTLTVFDRDGRAARPVWGAFVVNRFNQPPVAGSGPSAICFTGKPAPLHAGYSFDPDLDPLRSFDWQIQVKKDSLALKSGVFPAFKPDSIGTFPVWLSVSDSFSRSKIDSNRIFVFHTQNYPVKFMVLGTELGVPPDSLKSIALVGDFNHWSLPGYSLSDANNNGVWEANVALPPGEYEYKYVVNGTKWVPDPMNPRRISDGWNGFNSLRTVQRPPVPVLQWQSEVTGDSILLDASNSYDPMGDSITVHWIPDRLNPTKIKIPQKMTARFPVPQRDGVYFVQVLVNTPKRASPPQTILIKKRQRQLTIMNLEDSPTWAKKAVVYELYVRNFTKKGTLKAVRKNLGYLSTLGVNTIWLMPIFEAPSDHGYNPSNFRKIRPDYGNLQEFRNLVAAVHKKHMYIILDFVANHTGDQHPYFKCAYWNPRSVFRDWFIWRGKYAYTYYNDWDSFPNLNYKNPNVWHFVLKNAEYWARQGVDGFRCDVAWGVPHPFWKAFRRVLKGINPQFLLLDEVLPRSPAYHDLEFDMSYNTDFYGNLLDIFRGRKPLDALEEAHKKSLMNYPPQALSLNYLENHDLKRFLARFGAARTQLAAVLLFTFPGTPLIFSGQEQGARSAFPEVLKKDVFSPWFEFYQKLIALRQKNPPLQIGDYLRVQNDAPQKVFSYLRGKGENQFLVALNFSSAPLSVTLLLQKSRYPDLDSDNAEWRQVFPLKERTLPFGLALKIKLGAYDAAIFRLKRK